MAADIWFPPLVMQMLAFVTLLFLHRRDKHPARQRVVGGGGGQRDVFWRDPFRSLLIRASQLESALMFSLLCSNQPSSVVFGRLHSRSSLHNTASTTAAAAVAPARARSRSALRSRPWDAIVMRGIGIFHLSLVAWLAANGLCPGLV